MRAIGVLSFLLAIFFTNILQGQVILIPNGGFDTDTSGWSITGIDMSISTYGGELIINVDGVYTRDFILTSPSFHLDSAKVYKLHTDLRNVQEDSMGEQPLGGFDEINLIDANGQTVADVSSLYCDISSFLDQCSSNNFNVLASGTYSLEYIGWHNPEAEFIVDNVGLEEIIHNTFSGTVTLDINNDACASSGTTPEGLPIQLNETNSNTSYNVFTDVNGEFLIETQGITGNFVTQTNLALYNSTPVNYTTTISSGVNDITNQDFCIAPNATANDLMISLIPVSQARPGFNANYQIQYTNIGTTTLSGAVDLSFDANKLTLLNTSIIPNATTSTSLDWDYTNLMPLETRYIDIEFAVLPPPAVDIGDTLSYTATVTPISGDYTPSNNIFVLDQITIGSYDPNDITILEGPFISESQAADYLGILIRFQNTGTASAINVSVENTLDAFLDWSTFQPIASSHSYNTIISNDNEVNFVFNDIHLADSTTDEPGSHGWVYYNIKPKSSFDIGDVISTKADIYFDYNLPIITNTATTEIDPSLSINDEVSNENALLMYPNPVKDNLIISIQSNNAIYSLINIKGQVIKQGQLGLGDNILNLSTLSSGFYITKITVEGQTYTNKIYKK